MKRHGGMAGPSASYSAHPQWHSQRMRLKELSLQSKRGVTPVSPVFLSQTNTADWSECWCTSAWPSLGLRLELPTNYSTIKAHTMLTNLERKSSNCVQPNVAHETHMPLIIRFWGRKRKPLCIYFYYSYYSFLLYLHIIYFYYYSYYFYFIDSVPLVFLLYPFLAVFFFIFLKANIYCVMPVWHSEWLKGCIVNLSKITSFDFATSLCDHLQYIAVWLNENKRQCCDRELRAWQLMVEMSSSKGSCMTLCLV